MQSLIFCVHLGCTVLAHTYKFVIKMTVIRQSKDLYTEPEQTSASEFYSGSAVHIFVIFLKQSS